MQTILRITNNIKHILTTNWLYSIKKHKTVKLYLFYIDVCTNNIVKSKIVFVLIYYNKKMNNNNKLMLLYGELHITCYRCITVTDKQYIIK